MVEWALIILICGPVDCHYERVEHPFASEKECVNVVNPHIRRRGGRPLWRCVPVMVCCDDNRSEVESN